MDYVEEVASRPLKGPGAIHHCCYKNCKNDSRYNGDNLFYFIPFLKPCVLFRNKRFNGSKKKHIKSCLKCTRANNWLRLCEPKFGCNLNLIARQHYICSLHFVGDSGPTGEFPDPIKAVTQKKEVRVRRSLAEKYGAVMETENSSTSCATCVVPGLNEDNDWMMHVPEPLNQTKATPSFVDACTQTETVLSPADACTQTEPPITTTKITQTTSTIYPHMRRLNGYKTKISSLKRKLSEAIRAQSKIKAIVEFEREIRENDKQCFFYTGLHFHQIMSFLFFLGPAANNLHYWNSKPTTSKRNKPRKLSPLQELVVVLVRLRRGFLVRDLAYRFHLSASHITNVTITWVQFMYLEFGKLRSQMFPSRTQIAQNLPEVFKRLKNIRVLVDCTEFYCESPGNFQHQGNLYSSYKSHTTFKVLIGSTPNGAISFVSELYEGAISDRELFKLCGIIDLLDENDLVLADRGFTVEDLVEEKGAHLHIPPFLKGRDCLTAQEEIETKQIAKERIYVEHVIGRLKKYRILTRVLPLNMRGVISQIVFVCACLVNFQPPIL